MNRKALTDEDVSFCQTVSLVMLINPFSEERAERDRSTWGVDLPTNSTTKELEQLLQAVFVRIEEMKSEGKYNLSYHTGAHRELLRDLMFFDVHHRFRSEVQDFVIRQSQAQESLEVPFATDMIGYLVECGFPPKEALLFFEWSYQARRGYFFISEALAGESPSMIRLRDSLWNSVFSSSHHWYRHIYKTMEDFSTLLLGETGSGKSAAAMAIGRSCFIPYDETKNRFMESFQRGFISVNLSEFPEGVIESELFGHKKGAFTGALEDYDGTFQRCSPYGAIFLDEIGEISIPLQIKLLRVLQERTFRAVGSYQEQQFRGRIIAATHQPVDQLRRKKQMRDDFYYRLCTHEIVVPTLQQRIQERAQELDDLIALILRRISEDPIPGAQEMIVSTIHRELGPSYSWPGNVRELEQCVRRILLTQQCHSSQQSSDWMELPERLIHGIQTGSYQAHALMSDYCMLLYQQLHTYEAVAKQAGLDRRTVKKYIQQALGKDDPT